VSRVAPASSTCWRRVRTARAKSGFAIQRRRALSLIPEAAAASAIVGCANSATMATSRSRLYLRPWSIGVTRRYPLVLGEVGESGGEQPRATHPRPRPRAEAMQRESLFLRNGRTQVLTRVGEDFVLMHVRPAHRRVDAGQLG